MQMKRNQSKEPRDMVLSSKFRIYSMKNHIIMMQRNDKKCLKLFGQIYK